MITNRNVKVWGRPPIEVYRCTTCGVLVTNSQASLSLHQGHHVKQPVNVSLMEILGLWIGWIK